MGKLKKLGPLFLVVLMLSSGLVVFDRSAQPSGEARLVVGFSEDQVFANNVSITGSAFEVLASLYSVTPKEEGNELGVKGVNGLNNDESSVWRFYVNGALYSGPASSYVPEHGDLLVFRYESRDFNASRRFA